MPAYKLGQANAAERYLLEALQMTLEAGAAPIVLDAIINLAVLQHQRGQPELALAWACYIQQQRAAAQETKSLAGQLLAELQNEFTSSQLAAVQASAQTQTLEIVAREILERFYQ